MNAYKIIFLIFLNLLILKIPVFSQKMSPMAIGPDSLMEIMTIYLY